MSFTVWHFVVLYIQDYFSGRVYILDSQMWFIFFSFISKFYVLIILLLWNCLLLFLEWNCAIYYVLYTLCHLAIVVVRINALG